MESLKWKDQKIKYSFLAALSYKTGRDKSRISWPRKKLYGHAWARYFYEAIVDDAEGLITYHLKEIDWII